MKIDFKNSNVIITGATRGIGKAIADKFVKLGANIIGTSTKKNFKKKKIKIYKVNFLKQDEVSEFLNVIRKLNKIDILINNVGINKIDFIQNLKNQNIDNLININLITAIKISSLVSKKMISKRKGKILNISSIFGVIGKEKRSIYSATKSGLNGFTKSVSLDLAKYNIQVNSISPGFVATDLTKKILGTKGIKKIKKNIPLKRLASKEEISNLAIFLSSNYSNYITGQNIIIDGGYTSQ